MTPGFAGGKQDRSTEICGQSITVSILIHNNSTTEECIFICCSKKIFSRIRDHMILSLLKLFSSHVHSVTSAFKARGKFCLLKRQYTSRLFFIIIIIILIECFPGKCIGSKHLIFSPNDINRYYIVLLRTHTVLA